MNIFLVLGIVFLLTFLIGIGLERIRVPWIFGALIVGLGMAFYNPVAEITDSESFIFLARLGMFFLLFLIGFELDIEKIRGLKRFIFTSSFAVILSEAFFGSIFVHYVFHEAWFVSVLVALSFATVGEAVLIPILDEFRITKTRLGQIIIGIGTVDDIIEVLAVVLVAVSLPSLISGGSIDFRASTGTITALVAIAGLFIFNIALARIKSFMRVKRFFHINDIYPFMFAVLFTFVGVGMLTHADLPALGALLGGITVRNFLSKKHVENIEGYIKSIAYGFFGPIFFLWVGLGTDVRYVIKYPLLILFVILLTSAIKALVSYLMGRKELGGRESVVMGIALSVRFSTSIIIIKILFQNNIIHQDLYSVLIGSTAVFTFIIPAVLSYLIPRWRLQPEP